MKPRKADVFVSYAHADRQSVARVLSALRKVDPQALKRLFIPWDQVHPGENWYSAVGAAMARAEAVIFFASTHSLESPWCLSELQYFTGHPRFEGRVLPVLLGTVDDLPASLARIAGIRYARSPLAVARSVAQWLAEDATAENRKTKRQTPA